MWGNPNESHWAVPRSVVPCRWESRLSCGPNLQDATAPVGGGRSGCDVEQSQQPVKEGQRYRQQCEPDREDEPVAEQGWTDDRVTVAPASPDVQLEGGPAAVAQVREHAVGHDAHRP